jgi:hypothetical protein
MDRGTQTEILVGIWRDLDGKEYFLSADDLKYLQNKTYDVLTGRFTKYFPTHAP